VKLILTVTYCDNDSLFSAKTYTFELSYRQTDRQTDRQRDTETDAFISAINIILISALVPTGLIFYCTNYIAIGEAV